MADGDAVNIFDSHDLWVDHNFLANAADGLVDAIEG
jgi:pectate lyase